MSLPELGTLSVAGAGIRSVLFGSEFVEATIFPNSLLWDNIVIETEERQAPEPTMGLLSALALAALGSRLGRARN
jgi:hypothetical protein